MREFSSLLTFWFKDGNFRARKDLGIIQPTFTFHRWGSRIQEEINDLPNNLISELISCEADINTQVPWLRSSVSSAKSFPILIQANWIQVLLKFKYFLIFSLTSNKIFTFIMLLYSLQSAWSYLTFIPILRKVSINKIMSHMELI